MTIENSAFNKSTRYRVVAKVGYPNITGYKTTEQLIFFTQSPPTGGIVSVFPNEGELGETFNIVCSGWESTNTPLFFNVYYDEMRSIKLNDSPLPINTSFELFLMYTSPLLIEIYDSYGERTLEVL